MNLTSFPSAVIRYGKAHKIIASIIVIVVIAGGYLTYRHVSGSSTETRYILGTVERGTIVSSITGTGQVAASNELSITPKVSGQIISISVKNGDELKQGQVIAQLDATDALKAVKNARNSLANAQISYNRTIQQSQTGLTNDEQAVVTASTTLEKAYDDAFGAIATSFADFPKFSTDLDQIYNSPSHSPYFANNQTLELYGGSSAYTNKSIAATAVGAARVAYDAVYPTYQSLSLTSSRTDIENALSKAYDLAKKYADALNKSYTAIDYVNTAFGTARRPAEIATDETTVSSDVSSVNNDVSNLYNSIKAISDAKTNLTQTETSLSQANQTLNGVDTYDVESAKISLSQAEQAVTDALDNLADYTIRAPFAGVIAKVSANVDDNASAGTSLVTLITKQQIATITLTEVDAAKVHVGQKATVTFDALPDLSISGEVADIDAIGTVSQGVVTYSAKIAFDTQNDQVKSGMTATAAIITDSKTDVLMVPNSAIKTSGSNSFVQVLNGVTASSTDAETTGVISATPPQSVPVEIGISNDQYTEITSGLSEGDTIVTRTVTQTAGTTGAASTARTTTRNPTSVLGGGTGAARNASFGGGGAAAFGR